MSIDEQVELAERIARQRHAGQTDKGGHPYIGHPQRVAAMVASPLEKTVAWLHDTMEDTGYTATMMRADGFSEQVIEAMLLLTHKPHEPYMEYVHRLVANPIARQVKLADNMDLTVRTVDARRSRRMKHVHREDR